MPETSVAAAQATPSAVSHDAAPAQGPLSDTSIRPASAQPEQTAEQKFNASLKMMADTMHDVAKEARELREKFKVTPDGKTWKYAPFQDPLDESVKNLQLAANVAPREIREAVESGKITEAQATRFCTDVALLTKSGLLEKLHNLNAISDSKEREKALGQLWADDPQGMTRLLEKLAPKWCHSNQFIVDQLKKNGQ